MTTSIDRRAFLEWLAAAGAIAAAPSAFGEDPYPSRMVRVIAPYPPGGVTDIVGRICADIIAAKFGQSAIVENKPGATGVVAQRYVLGEKHDGYVLLAGGLGGLVLPQVTVADYPVESQKLFVPIAQVAEFVNVLVVNNDLPIHTVKELIDFARAYPGELNYVSQGVGTSAHLTGEFFCLRTGTRMVHIPFKGSGDMVINVRNGNAQLAFANAPSVVGQVKAGGVRALAVTSSYRTRLFPGVPTMIEAGVPDFDVTSWLGLYGPAGMPAAIVQQLSAATVDGARQPQQQARLQAAGFEPMPRDAAAFAALNRREMERWADVAKKAGIRLQM